jgi:hypothetical protein
MKAFPRYLNLVQKLHYIESELNQLPNKPYGRGNPYSYCPCCEKSVIDISIHDAHPDKLLGHEPYCKKGKFLLTQRTLKKDVQKNLNKFLKNGEFNSKSFLSFVFMHLNKSTFSKHERYLEDLIKKTNNYLDRNPELNQEIFKFHNFRK